jgi:hypothetical protein
MNDSLLNSPLTRPKTCPNCYQKDPLVQYINKELKNNKLTREKAAKILNLILEQLNKDKPKSNLKERANRA